MTETPAYLLQALDRITQRAAPKAETLGIARANQFARVRSIFEDRNIIGVGISEKISDKKPTGTLGVCFYVERKVPQSKLSSSKLLPPVIDSGDGQAIFTDVKVVGRISPEALKKRTPIQSGFSIGHVSSTAGTVGAIVKRGKKYYILSNSHVLALEGTAGKGDMIVYPGPADGGKLPKDKMGRLAYFVKFKGGGEFVNVVDGALAEILSDRADMDFTIHALKGVPATIAPKRGMEVAKRGRTTNETVGVIDDINFRFVLDYDTIPQVGFRDQVLCTRYTRPGDSGSIVVDTKSGKIVGLHFAGANGGSVFNPIEPVMKALKFRFVTS